MAKNTTSFDRSALPFLIAIVAIVAITLSAAGWVYTHGGENAAVVIAALLGFVGTSVLVPLYNAYQTRQVAAKVERIDAKVDEVAVQTDGKLNALMAATAGQAAAEGEIKGMAAARATAAKELQSRADAAALLAAQAPPAATSLSIPAGLPTKVEVSNPSVPVHLTDEEASNIAEKVTDRASEITEKKGETGD